MITSADDATENDKGPYFKDARRQDRSAPSRASRRTPNGLLKLPKMYADDTTGTFLLRLTTAGGATLTVELKVAAAPAVRPRSRPSAAASPRPGRPRAARHRRHRPAVPGRRPSSCVQRVLISRRPLLRCPDLTTVSATPSSREAAHARPDRRRDRAGRRARPRPHHHRHRRTRPARRPRSRC